ncbi:MAG TPA: DMT family transporter [Caulobacteraceae bacterium]|nr:DMT family transporter [Caulobacteraceae bacterium]
MPTLLWIPATVLASGFQVARNGLQRSILPTAGPWGATLVRFLFGLPFSIVFTALALAATPGARPHLSGAFWFAATTGAMTQMLATASLLVAMRRAGFAVGTALQQSSLPLAAILGLIIFHDRLNGVAWIGVGVTTVGLAVLTWPRGALGDQPVSGAAFGLGSGLCFGFSLNAFRHATLALDPRHALFAAVACVTVAQAIQSIVLLVFISFRHPHALAAIRRSWRGSLAAGFCGAVASALWFLALGLEAAAPVRAVGVVEAPIAAVAGRRFFAERLHPRQLVAGLAVIAGVVMTSIG